MILSDRDLTNTWSGAADGTLEARLYHLQNWRNDLCAVADGYVIVRHYRYSAYGTRTEVDGADYNRDGSTDFFDTLDFNADHGTSAARADFNNDGTVDNFDTADFVDAFNITSDDEQHAAPRGLYAGYEHDPALDYQGALSGGGAGIYTIESYAHVRHRVYSTELGRWTRRDPLGYHDGMGLYEYCKTSPLPHGDTYGLACRAAQPLKNGFKLIIPIMVTPSPSDLTWKDCEGPLQDCANAGGQIVPSPNVIQTSNGCGSGAFSKALVRILTLEMWQSFQNCCNDHDECYGTCGRRRGTCDSNLLSCHIAVCVNSNPGSGAVDMIMRQRCIAVAYEIYLGLRIGGGGAFCAAQEKNCTCSVSK